MHLAVTSTAKYFKKHDKTLKGSKEVSSIIQTIFAQKETIWRNETETDLSGPELGSRVEICVSVEKFDLFRNRVCVAGILETTPPPCFKSIKL